MHIFWWKGIFASPTNFLCYRDASRKNSDLLFRKFFFGGVTDDGSKSSSMKESLENGNILGSAKAADILFTVQEAWYAASVNDARSWTVFTLLGFAVNRSCCTRRNFPLNCPITPTQSGCNWWQQWRGKLLRWYRFLSHREWNQECNDFHDCPLTEADNLLWSF